MKTVYNRINKGVVEKVEDENVKEVDCNINYNLQFQLENKEKFINHLEEQIKQQYNQIQALNYQLLELNKNNTLLLEYKKWYQICK